MYPAGFTKGKKCKNGKYEKQLLNLSYQKRGRENGNIWKERQKVRGNNGERTKDWLRKAA